MYLFIYLFIFIVMTFTLTGKNHPMVPVDLIFPFAAMTKKTYTSYTIRPKSILEQLLCT